MSSEKRLSWRKGRKAWQTRIYLSQETRSAIEQQAKMEGRETASVITLALEKLFGGEERGGDKP